MSNTPDQFTAFLTEAKESGLGIQGNRKAPGMLAPYLDIVERVTAANERLTERRSAVMRDANLSREGRERALAALAPVAIKEFSFVGEKLTNAKEAVVRCQTGCLDYRARPTGNEVVQEGREREFRDSLRAKPQHDRDMAFYRAAERLDAEGMRGLMSGPGGPWISGEMLSRGETMYAERRNPQLHEQWQQIDVLIERLEGIARFAAQVLLTLGAERPATLKALGIEEKEEAAHA